MSEKIVFSSANEFELQQEKNVRNWLLSTIEYENKTLGEIGFVFCDDAFLLNLNQEYLQHDTFTDIISFDYSFGNTLQGEIYISTERVKENAEKYDTSFENELRRVMVHGVLHLCGYKDKTTEEKEKMRQKEDEKLQLFHVEQSPKKPSS
ncbi:MAG TPA: rRNA maturation RNase YbeY [Flavobacteriaceae bacterium]|nr:rRNA maturation RNase YbeY [Flavobacteriaceae bacterium]